MKTVNIKVPTTIYLPYDMRLKLKELAKKEDKTLNNLVIISLDMYLAAKKIKYDNIAFNGDKVIKI